MREKSAGRVGATTRHGRPSSLVMIAARGSGVLLTRRLVVGVRVSSAVVLRLVAEVPAALVDVAPVLREPLHDIGVLLVPLTVHVEGLLESRAEVAIEEDEAMRLVQALLEAFVDAAERAEDLDCASSRRSRSSVVSVVSAVTTGRFRGVPCGPVAGFISTSRTVLVSTSGGAGQKDLRGQTCRRGLAGVSCCRRMLAALSGSIDLWSGACWSVERARKTGC